MESILEYLLPLVIFLAFILPKLFKRSESKRVKADAKPEASNSGIFNRLNKVLEEYYENDKEKIPSRKEIEDYDAWMYSSDEQDDADDEENQDKVYQPVKKAEPVLETKVAIPSPSMQNSYKTAAPKPVPPPVVATTSESYRRMSNVSKKELRKAVIWSEILSRPVALRDE